MKIATAWSNASDITDTVDACCSTLRAALERDPDLVMLSFHESLDTATLAGLVTERFPQSAMQGTSSCVGSMTEAGFHPGGLSMIGFSDPEGDFGVAGVSMEGNPRGAARQAVERALESAGRPGELPALVWLNAAPGREEEVLQGIADVLGPNVPVAGGSSADDTVAGQWHQIAGTQAFVDAVTLVVMFPSGETGFSFHSGYKTTDHVATVTSAEGRVIKTLDGEPAAAVYNRWTNGSISGALTGGNILSLTSLAPLGREVGTAGKAADRIPQFNLSHPEAVTPDGGLALFTTISEGDEVVLMEGSRNSLMSRAGRVVTSAIQTGAHSAEEIAGGLVIYCAGCMLTIQDDMPATAEGIRTAIGGRPFLGFFTFGEQGCFAEGGNSHGNLMISVVTFGR